MQWYLVRHGESTNNRLIASTGSARGSVADPDLTELGRRQAVAVARFLGRPRPFDGAPGVVGADWANVHGVGVTHLYTSLMVRAVATTQAIALATGVRPVASVDLYEVGGVAAYDEGAGCLRPQPGMYRAFFEESFPELVLPADWRTGGWYGRPVEPVHERQERAARLLASLTGVHGGGDDVVVLVTHAGFLDHLLKALLQIRDDGRFRFAHCNAAVSRLDVVDGQAQLVYANRTCHLAADETT